MLMRRPIRKSRATTLHAPGEARSGLRAGILLRWLLVMSLVQGLVQASLLGLVPPSAHATAGNRLAPPDEWQRVALAGEPVRWIAASPTDPDLVYAAVDGLGVYGSDDAGASWSPLTVQGLTNRAVQTVVVCPAGQVLAGTWGGGVYRLQGSAWIQINGGLQQLFITSLACDDDNQALAGTFNAGIFRRPATAGFWSPANSGLSDPRVLTIRHQEGRLYAGTDDGAFRSDNGGASWTSLGLSGNSVFDFEFSPTDEMVLWAATTTSGVLRSEDDGASWSRIGRALEAYGVARDSNNEYFAGTRNEGIYWFTNGNWQRLNIPVSPASQRVYYIRAVGNLPGRVVAGTVDGIWTQDTESPVTPTPTATATPTATPTASPTPTATPTPGVQISLRSNPSGLVEQGEEITYIIDYQTVGNGVVSNVVISNPVPSGVLVVPGSIEPAGAGSVEDGIVVWRLGTLDSGKAAGTVSYRVRVPLPTPTPTPTATPRPEHSVAVTVVGSGTVANTPGNPYLHGETASLEPLPAAGWRFSNWEGRDAVDLVDNGDGTWSLLMDEDKAVTAVFADVPSSLQVIKMANPTAVPEPGGAVQFQVRVENTSVVDTISLTSLVDDVHGNLDGRGNCSLPRTLTPGGFYQCSFSAQVTGNAGETEVDTITATGSDDGGNSVSGDGSASVRITDVASSFTVTKTADRTSVAEPGGTVNFTVNLANDSAVDSITINSLVDDVHGILNGQGNCTTPQTLAPGGSYSCTFSAYVGGVPGDSETDIVTASGVDDDGRSVSDSDSATVNVTDVSSSIQVRKTANPSNLAEPGGSVEFRVQVDNLSATDSVTLNSLTDDIHGDLDGRGSCSVPRTIPVGGSTQCTFSTQISGNAGDQETDLVTATGVDDDGRPVSGSDSATVTIGNVASSIDVTKTANPSTLPEPGGVVNITVRTLNSSTSDSVTINQMVDSIYGNLNGRGTCALPRTIAPGNGYTCAFSVTVTGSAGDSETDVVTVSGVDDDGRPVSDSDSATVTISDVASSIAVTKTANPSSVSEPGGSVTFAVRIDNTSPADSVNITRLTDDGANLDGVGTCNVPASIPAGGFYQCSFTVLVTGNAGQSQTDIVMAEGVDDDGAAVAADDSATVNIIDVLPAITVTKTANPSTLTEPGGAVNFTVRVDNASQAEPVTITSLNDSIYGNLNGKGTCASGGTIAAGAAYQCSFSAQIIGTAGYSERDTVTVQARDDDGNTTSESDDASVTVTDAPSSLAVDKTANPTSLPEPGGDVTFSVQVQNTSIADSITLQQVADDVNNDGTVDVTYTPASICGRVVLAPAEGTTCTFTRSVQGGPGTITDRVTVRGTDDDNTQVSGSDTATVTLTNRPSSLRVSKTANPTSVPEPGDSVDFTVRITNTSAVDTVSVDTLTDDVHGNLDGRGSCDVPRTLAAGATYQCSFNASVSGNAGETETDTVTAAGVDDDGAQVSAIGSAQVRITDLPSSLQVIKSASPTTVAEPGAPVTFTVRIENTSAADKVTVSSLTDDIHGNLNGQGDCAVPQAILAGAAYECRFVAQVPKVGGGAAGNAETDTVTASGTDDDGKAVTASDSATVNIVGVTSSIQVLKTASPSNIPEPGGLVDFIVRIENTSETDVVTIDQLTDDVHGDLNGRGDCRLPATIAVGAAYQCSFTVQITGEPGYSETDTVTASGQDDDGFAVIGSDSATVNITDVASSVNVSKSANPAEVTEPGGTVNFTVVVENTSLKDAVTIDSLSDDVYGDLDGRGSCSVPQTLAVGEGFQCSFSADVSGDGGSAVTDTVTASGTDDDGVAVSGSDSATVNIVDVASSISVGKSANPSSVDEPGGTVDYTITVDNTSSLDAVTIDSLSDDVYGDLNGQGNCSVPQTLAVGQGFSCTFSGEVSGNAGDAVTDVVTASGTDDDGVAVNGSASATVNITDVASSINVGKSASPASVDEPGGSVNFSVSVQNTSAVDTVTLDQVADDEDNDGFDDAVYDAGAICDLVTLGPGESASCSFSRDVNGNAGDAVTDVASVTGTDDDGAGVSGSASATVNIADVASSISVGKSASPGEVTEPGGPVEFTVTVQNDSVADTVTLDQVADDEDNDGIDDAVYAAGSICDATDLAPGQGATCSFSRDVNGSAGQQMTDVVTVTGTDDDGSGVSSSASATVNIVAARTVQRELPPYLPVLLVGGAATSGAHALPDTDPLGANDTIVVVNTGAFVSWEYNGVTYQARSNPVTNGRNIYLPIIVRLPANRP